MTAHERASYLIKEYGLQIAIDHVVWVIDGCVKDLTRDYRKEVLDILVKRKEQVEKV